MSLIRFKIMPPSFCLAFTLAIVATSFTAVKLYAIENLLSASQIRAAMHSERSKIASGKFVANGRFSQSALGKEDRGYSFSWKYEFDLIQGTFLFDRTQSVKANRDTRGSDSELLRVFFCEDRKTRYTYEDFVVPIACLYKQDINDSTEKLKSDFKRLDVSGLGFYNLEDIIEMSAEGDRGFFESKSTSIDEIQVERESQNIVRLWYEDRLVGPDGKSYGPEYKLCLWIDTEKGFTPVRKATYANGKIELDFNSDWELVNKAWVPRRLTGRSSIPFLPDGKEFIEENIAFRSEEFEMDLAWSSVNEFKSPEFYDFKEFDFTKGTQVVEAGKLVHVYGYELPARPEVPKTRKLSKYLMVLAAFTGAVLLFLGFRSIKAKK